MADIEAEAYRVAASNREDAHIATFKALMPRPRGRWMLRTIGHYDAPAFRLTFYVGDSESVANAFQASGLFQIHKKTRGEFEFRVLLDQGAPGRFQAELDRILGSIPVPAVEAFRVPEAWPRPIFEVILRGTAEASTPGQAAALWKKGLAPRLGLGNIAVTYIVANRMRALLGRLLHGSHFSATGTLPLRLQSYWGVAPVPPWATKHDGLLIFDPRTVTPAQVHAWVHESRPKP